MTGKHYKQRITRIRIRPSENPREYHRRYYWLVVKGVKRVPPKMRGRKN